MLQNECVKKIQTGTTNLSQENCDWHWKANFLGFSKIVTEANLLANS